MIFVDSSYIYVKLVQLVTGSKSWIESQLMTGNWGIIWKQQRSLGLLSMNHLDPVIKLQLGLWCSLGFLSINHFQLGSFNQPATWTFTFNHGPSWLFHLDLLFISPWSSCTNLSVFLNGLSWMAQVFWTGPSWINKQLHTIIFLIQPPPVVSIVAGY